MMDSKFIKKIGVLCQHTKTDTMECLEKICVEPSDKEFSDMDFDDCMTYHIQIPSHDSSESRQLFTDYEWTDHCPEAFRNIRQLKGVDSDEYMLAIRTPETIKELYSMKKANRPIGFHDKKFLVRLISKNEIKILREILPNYYSHVQKYNNTLLSKIYGIHVFKPSGGQKVRFVAIGNQMLRQKKIHKQYYFKTNLQGKMLSRSGADEDLTIGFHIQPSIRTELLKQVKIDSEFLEEEKIQDYAFMIGMHVLPTPFDVVAKTRPREQNSSSNSNDSSHSSDSDGDSNSQQDEQHKCSLVNIPARAVDMRRLESGWNPQGNTKMEKKNNVVLYLGIIDTSLEHSVLKRVENMFRSLQSDTPSSSSKPKAYARNFQEMVASIFPADGSPFNTNHSH